MRNSLFLLRICCLFFYLAILAFTAEVFAQKSPLAKKPDQKQSEGLITRQEYAVISAVLDRLPRYNFYTEKDPGLLIRDLTNHQISQKFQLPVDIYPELKSQTWYNWLEKFADKFTVDKKLKTKRPYQLATSDFESRLTIVDPKYQQMTKLGYDKVIGITRPGFDKHQTQAIIYLFSDDFPCDGLKIILVKNFGSYWDVDKNTINKKPQC